MRKFVWILTAMIVIVSIFLVIVVNVNNTNEEHVKSKDKENKNYSSLNGIDMVFVEGGTFQMGSKDENIYEKPVHRVTLSDFYIGKCEVTQEQYEEVIGNNPSYFMYSGKNAPVEQVSWYDVVDFCNELSEKEGLKKCYSDSGDNIKCDFSANGYRLPTEAEWEYAAKGGNQSKGYKYAGSNDIDEVGWYGDNANWITHPVGGKKANELGIYDMSGNVWEWCWDKCGSCYYGSSPEDNPVGPDSGSHRVLRGGSWDCYAWNCRSTFRDFYTPDGSPYHLGFRIARSLPR